MTNKLKEFKVSFNQTRLGFFWATDGFQAAVKAWKDNQQSPGRYEVWASYRNKLSFDCFVSFPEDFTQTNE